MITSEDLEAEIILYAVEKANGFFTFLPEEINIEKMKEFLKAKFSGINFEDAFKEGVFNLISQKILTEDMPFYLGIASIGIGSFGLGYPFTGIVPREMPKKLYLNKDGLRARISSGSVSKVIERVYIEKENKAKKEIVLKLNKLREMITTKKTETELHNYIKENKLIPAPFIQHEFQSIVQNRQDFLIKNEFEEFEIWELKSPSTKLFSGEIVAGTTEKYKMLKMIFKSEELVKAIEQLSVYKKEFIDYNLIHPTANTNLKENIYNAKLVLVIGSSDEIISDVYLEKLNLERYMLNNLNIITWEMFYSKIESYYKQMINS